MTALNDQEITAIIEKFEGIKIDKIDPLCSPEPGITEARVIFASKRWTCVTVEVDWDMNIQVEDNGAHWC